MSDSEPVPVSEPMPMPVPPSVPLPAGASAPPRAAVLAIVNDLFFQAKIGEVLRTLEVAVVFAKTKEGVEKRLSEARPDFALVDMGARGVDGDAAIRAIRAARPEAFILAFVSHVDKDSKVKALEAGASEAWAKSRLERELPDLVRRKVKGSTDEGPEPPTPPRSPGDHS